MYHLKKEKEKKERIKPCCTWHLFLPLFGPCESMEIRFFSVSGLLKLFILLNIRKGNKLNAHCYTYIRIFGFFIYFLNEFYD